MKELSTNQQHELEKYIDVYTYGTTSTPGIYGHNNWGADCYEYIKTLNIQSLLDVGCGKGVFVNDMSTMFNIPYVYGLDIASVRLGKHIQNENINWIDSQAHDIPMNDNSIEYITSFDCLEHVLQEDVDAIVDEFHRVCTKGLILRITYRQAHERSKDGEVLHMTVQPQDWWIEKFSRKFELNSIYSDHYLIFTKP
jgi:ubiquinone/menaquinone biosynthesis C-methylase UbiE